jgi:hypothetical protein
MARSNRSTTKTGFGSVSLGTTTIPFELATRVHAWLESHPRLGRGDLVKRALEAFLDRDEKAAPKAAPKREGEDGPIANDPMTAEEVQELNRLARAEVRRLHGD